jgi:hypothetical protein
MSASSDPERDWAHCAHTSDPCTTLPHGRTTRNLGDEGRASYQRSVRIGVEEVLGKVGLEPCRVGFVDGTDIVMVQRSQCLAVLFWFPHRDSPTP